MFTTIVTQPLYNALIALVNFAPQHDLWISVVVLTVIFKTILLPLYKKQIKDQITMNFLAPKLKVIQEKYKDQKDVLAKETLALYTKYKINPFVSILLLIIQLPFLIGLYNIFYNDLSVYQNLLYSFVSKPENINHLFLGVNLTEKNLYFALLAALSQYVLGLIMFKKKSPEDEKNETELVRAMNTQMKFVLPVVIGIVSYITPSVISLYLIVTNLYGIAQEIVVKGPLEKELKKTLA